MPDSVPNEFERLQSVLRLTYNKTMRRAFKDDLQDGNPDHVNEIALRDAVTIKDDDSAGMMTLRMLTGYMLVPEAFHGGRTLIPADSIYGIPKQEYDESVLYKPQVILKWKEPKNDADREGRARHTMRMSFRLMKDTEDLTQLDVNTLRLAIQREFPTGQATPFYFKTGRVKCSYRQKNKGYEFIISAYSLKEAEILVRKVLDIQGDTFDAELLTESSKPNVNWKARKTQRILGETTVIPEKRRIARVRLYRAELHLHGHAKGIELYQVFF